MDEEGKKPQMIVEDPWKDTPKPGPDAENVRLIPVRHYTQAGLKAAMDEVRERRAKRKRIKNAYIIMLTVIATFVAVLLLILGANRLKDRIENGPPEKPPTAVAEAVEEQQEGAVVTAVTPDTVESADRITFSAVGDNLIHGSIFRAAASRADYKGYDFDYCYEEVKPFFQDHDINWINMETLVNDTYPAANYPRFSTPGEDGLSLYDAGFRIFSLSSNHTYDLGDGGVEATLAFYGQKMPNDILTTGIWKNTDYIPVYEYSGRKIAFLTYTYGTNVTATGENGRVILLNENTLIREQIAAAKEQADCVIVSCHWGDENSHAINDEQRVKAQQIADWGADLIIGTHPHVVQDYTWLHTSDGREVYCAYSIGNFISGQKDMHHLIGLILECTLAFADDGAGNVRVTVEDPALIPIVTHYDEAFTNLRVMLLSDYTRELAVQHGVQEYSDFTYDGIFDILQAYVIGDCLKLPQRES